MVRRRWRVLTWAAPSLDLSAETDPYALDYPFSVKAERILTPKDLMDIQVCLSYACSKYMFWLRYTWKRKILILYINTSKQWHNNNIIKLLMS